MRDDTAEVLRLFMVSDAFRAIKVMCHVMFRLIDELPEHRRAELLAEAREIILKEPSG